jgi:hypothetical protein
MRSHIFLAAVACIIFRCSKLHIPTPIQEVHMGELKDALYLRLCKRWNQDVLRALFPRLLTNRILSWPVYMQTSACNQYNSEYDRTRNPVLTSDLES